MGQTLSEPVTKKWSFYGEDDRLVFGASEMQGWRLTMEDEHALILSLDEVPGTSHSASGGVPGDSRDGVPKDGQVTSVPEELKDVDVPTADGAKVNGTGKPVNKKKAFFAVYDGHGGATTARQAGRSVHLRLRETDEYKKGEYPAALKRAFLSTDDALKASPEFWNDPSGCTAVAALITEDNRIIVANAGDSRSVMSVGGKVKELSFDHKPMNVEENARITKAGGFVEFGRVNGNLALSRALGDFEFKRNDHLPAEDQIVTSDPDITIHESTPEDEFLILACDGIWDVVSSQRAVDLVRRRVAAGVKLDQICEDLMDRCLAPDSDCGGIGCDNMTLVIVALLGGRTKEEWYKWVKERVDGKVGYDTPEEWPGLAASVEREADAGARGGAGLAGLGGLGGGRFLIGGPGGPRILSGLGGNGDDEGDDDGDDDGEDPRQDALRTLQAALRASGPAGMDDTSDEEDEEDEIMEEAGASKPVGKTNAIEVEDDADATPIPTPSPSIIRKAGVADAPPHVDKLPQNVIDERVGAARQATANEAASTTASQQNATNETPAAAVKQDGLMDKSDDPLRAATSPS